MRTGIALSADRWVLAHEDGTLVIVPLATHGVDDLAAAVARATRFRLPAP